MCALQNNTKELDFDYFVELFEEYYLSDDPSDLGNFINGRLEFPTQEDQDGSEQEEQDIEDVDPGLVDQRINSSTSLHSMDDDLQPGHLQTHADAAKWNAQEFNQPNPNGGLKKMLSNFKSCCIF